MASPRRTPSPLATSESALRPSPAPSGSKPLGSQTGRPLDPSRADALSLYRAGVLASPPAIHPDATESPTSPASGAARRPRAGTLPSTFVLGGASSTSSHALVVPSPSRNDLLRPITSVGMGSGSLSVPASGGNTPDPDGTAAGSYFGSSGVGPGGGGTPKPSASSSDLAALRARARAGTVAFPPSSTASAFGRGVFSANFVPRSTSRMNEEVKSIKSDDEESEKNHINTLDYLGLDTDSPISPPSVHATLPAHPQSTLSSSFQALHVGRQQHQDTMASLSGIAGRLRASTVSGLPPRQPPIIRRTSPLVDSVSTNEPGGDASDPAHYATLRGRLSGAIKSADPTPPEGHLLYSSSPSPSRSPSMEASPGGGGHNHLLSGSLAANRPRASTLGGSSLLGAPMSNGSLASSPGARQRAGTMATLVNPGLMGLGGVGGSGGNLASPFAQESNLSANSLGFVPSGEPPQPLPWGAGVSRPLTPESAQQAMLNPTAAQQPSRSLWIGNLDAKTSAQELMTVFSVYGAIQSLRLLPEKECGFVNFISIHDAVHAKNDVLNRLGGQIPLRNGPAMVRIGFGKPESAPPTPAAALLNGRASTAPAATQTGGGVAVNGGGAGSGGGGVNGGAGADSSLQTSPTRALWVGSIPAQTTPSHLMEIFAPYGAIESARVLTHKNCGFINFEHLDDAVRARKALNGREILGAEVGAIKIGFAKVPVKAPGTFSPTAALEQAQSGSAASQAAAYEALARMRGASAVPLEQQIFSGSIQDYRSNLAMSFIPNGVHAFAGFAPSHAAALMQSAPAPDLTEMQLLMRTLSGDEKAVDPDEQSVASFRPPATYYTSIPPPVNSEDPHRRMAMAEAPRLRDVRKRIDTGVMAPEELDQIATDLLEEIVYLSSDYIGNTIVQKLFERCTHPVKMLMLERIAPHLAIIGCHKNGTWAAQKIIDCARTPEEIALICANLRPFAPPLLLDPLGNYVVQGVLRFGSPANDFAFDAMVDRAYEIAQGRFGARSVRTCLESEHASRLQVKRVAIAIILNSIPLATNPNGALLLTWLLDTSNLPGRYRLLAPRLAPHLSHLCTHKLASLTVLRIINQKHDPEAAKAIIDALFHSSRQVLEEVLGDQVHGITVIQKILASAYIEPASRPLLCDKAKEVLLSLRVQSVPAYRKLADDLGIPLTPANVAQMAGRTPPRAPSQQQQQQQQQQQPVPTWQSPLAQSGAFSPYGSFMAPPAGMPPMHMHFGPASPLMRGLSPAANGGGVGGGGAPILFPQIGSPDPFNALRYPQPFTFTPAGVPGAGTPTPPQGLSPYMGYDNPSRPGQGLPIPAYQQ